jgi:hypothetical protein
MVEILVDAATPRRGGAMWMVAVDWRGGEACARVSGRGA